MAEWIRSVISSLGYPGIALLSFLETLVPPVPSEIVGPLAGFAVTQGEITFVGAVLSSMVGFLAGVMPLYYFGCRFGKERLKRWADRYGRWLGISGSDIDRADAWFDRHSNKVVIISHLAPGIRSLISVPAGIAGMNVFKFLIYTAIGKGIWTVLMVYLGTVLGENYEEIGRVLGPVSYVVIGAIVVAFIGFVWQRKRHKNSSGKQWTDSPSR